MSLYPFSRGAMLSRPSGSGPGLPPPRGPRKHGSPWRAAPTLSRPARCRRGGTVPEGRESMCAGAVVQARLPLVVYGCADPKAGACDTLYRITDDARLNHRARVLGGVAAERCAFLLSEFFAAKRRLGKK